MPATPRSARLLAPALTHDAQAACARSSNNERATPYQIERAQPFRRRKRNDRRAPSVRADCSYLERSSCLVLHCIRRSRRSGSPCRGGDDEASRAERNCGPPGGDRATGLHGGGRASVVARRGESASSRVCQFYAEDERRNYLRPCYGPGEATLRDCEATLGTQQASPSRREACTRAFQASSRRRMALSVGSKLLQRRKDCCFRWHELGGGVSGVQNYVFWLSFGMYSLHGGSAKLRGRC